MISLLIILFQNQKNEEFRSLYSEIQPYNEFKLKVSELHTLHVEECGNPLGKPVIYLHGGPGSGCSMLHRRFFNPKK